MKRSFSLFMILLLLNSCSENISMDFNNSIGMDFVYIEPGTFRMGAGPYLDEKYKEKIVEKGYYIQVTEVTIGQWKKFIESTNYKTDAEKEGDAYIYFGSDSESYKVTGAYWNNINIKQTDQHPVTCLSKNDIYMFLKWLNDKEGNYYRLPTEAEWEYACRAGTKTHHPAGKLGEVEKELMCVENDPLDRIAWFCYNSGNSTHPVGGKEPNSWGLYDVIGNVWEFVEEDYSYDYSNIEDSLLKGGAWNDLPINCMSGRRLWYIINKNSQGFRIVRDLKEHDLKKGQE